MDLVGDPFHLYIARADVPWEERDGQVLVAVTKDEGAFSRVVSKLIRAPQSVSIRLDRAGTATWLLADGTRTGEEIAEALAAKFGGEGWPLRTKDFLLMLHSRGLLRSAAQPTRAADSLAGFPPHSGFRATTCARCKTTVRLKGPTRALYQCPGCGKMTRAGRA